MSAIQQFMTGLMPEQQTNQEQNKISIVLSSLGTGASVGSAIGLSLGPMGFVVGLVVGAVIGVFVALAKFAIDERAERLSNKQISNQTAAAQTQPKPLPNTDSPPRPTDTELSKHPLYTPLDQPEPRTSFVAAHSTGSTLPNPNISARADLPSDDEMSNNVTTQLFPSNPRTTIRYDNQMMRKETVIDPSPLIQLDPNITLKSGTPSHLNSKSSFLTPPNDFADVDLG